MANGGTANPADNHGFTAMITIFFLATATLFLFPSNKIIPLDRRVAGLTGGAFCIIFTWVFSKEPPPSSNDKEDRIPLGWSPHHIDVVVLLILLAIMIINFIIMRQDVVLKVIRYTQNIIRTDVNLGYWLVCLIAFCTSPFITNDGLCLLIVEPVLDAFLMTSDPRPLKDQGSGNSFLMNLIPSSLMNLISSKDKPKEDIRVELKRLDHQSNRFFYMLGIACASNIGSSMTFCGNPQNIIIAEHAGHLMSGGVFFALMIPPALLSFFLTCGYINRLRVRTIIVAEPALGGIEEGNAFSSGLSKNPLLSTVPIHHNQANEIEYSSNSNADTKGGDADEEESVPSEIAELIGQQSWIAFPLFAFLVGLELVGLIPLVALFPLVAIYLVVAVVLANYYAGYPKSWPDGRPMTSADRIKLIIRYVEDMFNDLDYNLIIIFSGLFIVAGSFVDTGVPAALWNSVAGTPAEAFKTGQSLFLISLYTIIASQLIGNVAVIIMAEDQIVLLDENRQRFGWLVMAWVSTIAGNFTLAGSAANIIVAEKAMRHGAKSSRGGDKDGSAHSASSAVEANKGSMALPGEENKALRAGSVANPSLYGDFRAAPTSAKVAVTSVEHFKICGVLTIICIVIGTVILWVECKGAGFI